MRTFKRITWPAGRGLEQRLIRFAGRRRHDESRRAEGLFVALYRLLRDPATHPDAELRLGGLIDWFCEHLPAPEGVDIDPRTIFWFKGALGEMTAKLWETVRLLRDLGVDVALLTTTRPGYVVFEDDFQVGAIPFRDTVA